MKLIKNILIAASLLAFSSTSFALTVTPGALGHIDLNGTSDTVFITNTYPSGTGSAFYDLSVSQSTNVVADFRALFNGTVPVDDVTVSIFNAPEVFIGGLTPLSSTLGVNESGTNVVSAFLTAGVAYILQFDQLTSNPGFSGTISTVPVPAAGILFASALLGAGFLGRRKKKATKSNMIGAFARAA